MDHLPIFTISGWSGSGKTTLLESLIPHLIEQGIKVVVVKHDAHGLDLDPPGKDSDRLFRAGADVALEDSGEGFLRLHSPGGYLSEGKLHSLARRYDLVLLEGHKQSPFPKIWLLREGERAPPEDVPEVTVCLSPGDDRLTVALRTLEEFLLNCREKTPVFGCVLIGGESRRMGSPKHLLLDSDRTGWTWLERTVEVLETYCERVIVAGRGGLPGGLSKLPRLEDAPDAEGPMAGLLAAMRWAPWASWLVAACDLPRLSGKAVEWLLETRRPGFWATIPCLGGSAHPEPLLANYDFRARSLLEESAARGNFSLSSLATHSKVLAPRVPPEHRAAWKDADTPDDL